MALKTQNYVFIGLGLVLALGGLFYNHKDSGRAGEASGNYVEVDASHYDESNDGKLIVLSGLAQSEGEIRDISFGVSVNGVKLERTVESYQWIEICENEGDSESEDGESSIENCRYEREWREELVDSSEYSDQRRNNPASRIYSSKVFVPENITVGEYAIPAKLAKDLISEKLDLLSQEILDVNYRLYDNYLTNSKDPTRPQTGDIRISYRYVPEQDVTVLAMQENHSVKAYEMNGKTLFDIAKGKKSGSEMVEHIATKSRGFRNVFIVIGIALVAFGLIGKARTGKKS